MLALPRVMGHRGAAALAPENTLAGLRRAAASGVSWAEFDVMLTRDSVPVLFHDDKLKRTTGRRGLMVDTPYEVVRTLDAGAWFGPEFAGEPVPTLAAALSLVHELGLRANIEIKPTPGRDRETAAAVADVLADVLAGLGPPHPAHAASPLLSSFSRDALAVVQARVPEVPRGFLARRLPRDWVSAARALACSTLHVAEWWLTEKRAARIKAAGYGLATFTVNDVAQARRLLDWGVDCIITDSPDAMVPALG